MNMPKYLAVSLCLLSFCAAATAQSKTPTVSGVLDHAISNVEQELVPAAEAMPEDKYSFVPSGGDFKGVRTFGEQLKHIAAVNYVVGAAMLGEKAPVDTGGENGPDSAKNKAEIVQFLKGSFTYLHKATGTVTPQNQVTLIKGPFGDQMTRLAMADLVVGHCFDHYGQIVVYLRLNGIIPPASRR